MAASQQAFSVLAITRSVLVSFFVNFFEFSEMISAVRIVLRIVSYTARQRTADTRFSPDNIIGLPIYEVYEQSKNTTSVEQNNSVF